MARIQLDQDIKHNRTQLGTNTDTIPKLIAYLSIDVAITKFDRKSNWDTRGLNIISNL